MPGKALYDLCRSLSCYVENAGAVCRRFRSRQVENASLGQSADPRVRLFDKRSHTFRKPMVTPGRTVVSMHTLLHDSPIAVIRQNKVVKIQLIAILNCGIVYLGGELAGAYQCMPIQTRFIGNV